MSKREELLALAERVAAATGPDRELEAAVWLHLPEQEGHAWKHGGNRYKHAHQIAGCSFIPAYTASLDAAMGLVPEGRFGSIVTGISASGNVGYIATLSKPRCECSASTPALALCAAALRARAAMETDNG